MIHLPNNPVSQYYRKQTEESFEKFGYSVIPFEGSTPETMGDEIQFGIKDNGGAKSVIREFTPTEKAIWHSNYRLWKKCVELDEPIIVIEHDSLLVMDFDRNDFQQMDVGVLSTKPRMYGFQEGERDWVPTCGSGYFIRPKAAKVMLDLDRWKVDCNSDGHILRCMIGMVGLKNLFAKAHIRHNYDPEIGSTIDHKHDDMKIV